MAQGYCTINSGAVLPPFHMPSVGCFGIGCWDLALPWLPLMYRKRVGGWSLAHSLRPVNVDGCFCWRMGRVYVQCQWIFMCLKHICGGWLLWIWEQELTLSECQGGVWALECGLGEMRISIQRVLWLKMSLSLWHECSTYLEWVVNRAGRYD